MKNPILRGVNPWLRILRSIESDAAIVWAEQPGFAYTKRLTSSISLFNRAFFCAPLPIVGGDIGRESFSFHIKETRGVPNTSINGKTHQCPTDGGTWLRW